MLQFGEEGSALRTPSFKMFDICPDAQQAVVSALNTYHLRDHKLILRHSPGEIQSSGYCNLGTHDLFRELIEARREDFIYVFPNIHSVVNAMRKSQTHGFSLRLSCPAMRSVISLVLLLNSLKNVGGHKFITQVRSLCRLPEKTLKPHATLAYVVGLSSDRCSHIDIQWSWDLKKSDDLSIPKAMYALDVVQNILGKKNGLLSSFRAGRNGCTNHDDSNNSKAIAYDAYKRSHSQYPREFSHLLQTLFQEAKNIPLAIVQIKKAINWDWVCTGNQIAFTMLCLKHLDHAEQSQFACFLTQQRIYFYFPKRNVIWIDLRGIDSNILVKLMNYAEVPLPTSNQQGAFSITLQGDGIMSSNNSYHLECKIGRIGAITVIPVQVRVEEVQPLIGEPLEKTKLAQELLKRYRAYNFKQVMCTDEEGNGCEMIQFLVPQSFEDDFPCQITVEDLSVVIDHALPYSLPLSIPSRPPTEETRHDHWNKVACYRQVDTIRLLPKEDALDQ